MRVVILISMAVVALCAALMIGFLAAAPIEHELASDNISLEMTGSRLITPRSFATESSSTALEPGFLNTTIEADPDPSTSTPVQTYNQTAASVTSSDGVLFIATIDHSMNTTSDGTARQPRSLEGISVLHAINTSTGTVVWEYVFDSLISGEISVIDNLVVTATSNGRLFLFNRTTGRLLLDKEIASPSSPSLSDEEVGYRPGVSSEWPNNTSPSSIPRSLRDLDVDVTPAPNLSIQSPSAGERLPSGDLTISVEVLNFDLVDPRTVLESRVEGQGHLHFFLDCTPPTKPNCVSKLKADEIVETINTSHTWEQVTPGTHSLAVMLVNNDHTPLQPPVVKSVIVTVEDSIPETDPAVTPVLEAHGEVAAVHPIKTFDFGNAVPGLRNRN